jgi:hypothetical protein
MRNSRIIGLAGALLLLSAVVVSQIANHKNFDSRAAEQHFRDQSPNRSQKSLHEFERFPDGARGFGVGAPIAQRIALPNPPPPPFATELEWETFHQYCGRDAIVRATHVDSIPILTSNKGLIYTVSNFVVVDTIKSDIPFTPGQHLVVYRVGGEVQDDGEKLRIDTPDMAAFEPQKSYILVLRRDKNASVQQYAMPEAQTIAVKDDRVYPISGRYAWLTGMNAFPTGSTYAVIRNTFARVQTLKSCTDAR